MADETRCRVSFPVLRDKRVMAKVSLWLTDDAEERERERLREEEYAKLQRQIEFARQVSRYLAAVK